MIQLFRIAAAEHIRDISGTGARMYGGRWNNTGYPVVYASGSRSLAALEFLVHVPMAVFCNVKIPTFAKKRPQLTVGNF